jgi:hypothetical protein
VFALRLAPSHFAYQQAGAASLCFRSAISLPEELDLQRIAKVKTS